MIRRLTVPIMLLMILVPSAAGAQSAQETLWDASKTGDTVTMASALADGAKLDALDTRRSRNGRYPLNYAAWFDHPEAGRRSRMFGCFGGCAYYEGSGQRFEFLTHFSSCRVGQEVQIGNLGYPS